MPMSRTGRILVTSAVGVLAAGLSMVASAPSYAHGYTTSPTSRAEFCANGTVSDCGAIQYEPQSVEAPKGFPQAGPSDGHICAGDHADFAELDDPRNGDWPTTDVTAGAQYTFQWHLTARHATEAWDYYITNDSYDPTKPLTRAELEPEPFLHVDGDGSQPPADASQTGTLPNKSGRQMILAVWSVADTGNAFYQCSDVNFG